MKNTPMSRVKDSIKELDRLISPAFNHYILNKSAPKSDSYYHSSKGVSSDFIYIFKSRSSAGDLVPSFGIIVDYMDRDLEDSVFTITKQEVSKRRYYFDHEKASDRNKEIAYGPSFSLEEFKQELRSLNRKLRAVFDGERVSPDMLEKAVFHILDESFFNSPELVQDEQALSKDLKAATKDASAKRMKIQKELEEMDEDMKARNRKVKNSIARSKPQKELNELRKERDRINKMIREREEEVRNRETELTVTNGIPELLDSMKKKEGQLKAAEAAEEKVKVQFFLDNKVTKNIQKKLDGGSKPKRN